MHQQILSDGQLRLCWLSVVASECLDLAVWVAPPYSMCLSFHVSARWAASSSHHIQKLCIGRPAAPNADLVFRFFWRVASCWAVSSNFNRYRVVHAGQLLKADSNTRCWHHINSNGWLINQKNSRIWPRLQEQKFVCRISFPFACPTCFCPDGRLSGWNSPWKFFCDWMWHQHKCLQVLWSSHKFASKMCTDTNRVSHNLNSSPATLCF